MPEEGTKYDWFKNELVGNTANFADLYQDGYMPEQFESKDVEDYWNNEEIRKPFEENYGEEGRTKFDEMYKQSGERLDAYRQGRFDISTTSEKRMLPTRYGKRLAALGLTKLYNNPSIGIPDIPPDLEGRDIVNGIYSRPEYSIREGAFKNGVLVNEKLMDEDTYNDTIGDPLVYAVDDNGAPLLHEGKNYLRPLSPGEEKKPHEEYATSFSNYMGFNGLDTPEWYALKFAPKNAANFAADVLDSGAELIKMFERFTLDRGEETSDLYNSLTDFQNLVGGYVTGSTSDTGRQSWTSVEGLTDGLTQVVFQLAGMYGVAMTTGKLLSIAKMGSEAGRIRAASVASRMFMSTLAADGLQDQAVTADLSPREQGIVHALSLLGYYKISRLSEWVIGTSPAMQKLALDAVLKKNAIQGAKAIQKTGDKWTLGGLSRLASNGVREIDNLVKNTINNPNAFGAYITAGSLEALEEVSESFMELGIKETYDRIYQPLLGSSAIGDRLDTNIDKRFNTDYSTLASELAQAATLGFVGGGIAKRFLGNKQVTADYYKYLASGKFPEVKKRLEVLHQKGALGDSGVNADGKPVKKGEQSRNDIAFGAIMSDLHTAEMVWNSKGLNTALDTNAKKLAFIRKSEDLKNTSIGKDLADQLTEIDTSNDNNEVLLADKNSDNTKKIEANNAKIKKANSEIDAIKSGKRVTKYLQEILHSMYKPITDFNRFYELNDGHASTLKARDSKIETITEAEEKANVNNIEEYSAISAAKGEELTKQANEKYPTIPDTIPPEREGGDKYEETIIAIDKAVESGQDIPSVEEEILSNFDASYKKTQSFEEILSNEKEKKKEFEDRGTGIYDDIDGLSEVINNIQSRIDQLVYGQLINHDINDAHTKLEEDAREVIFDSETIKELSGRLSEYSNEFGGLLATALENALDFDNAIIKASQANINDNALQLKEAVDLLTNLQGNLFQGPGVDEVSENLVAISNTTDFRTKQQLIVHTQKLIHNFFANDKQTALNALYASPIDVKGNSLAILSTTYAGQQNYNNFLGSGNGKTGSLIKPNPVRYLKTIITLDPERFYSHYAEAVQATPDEESTNIAFTKSRHVLSPAQRDIVQQLAAFSVDNSKKVNLQPDELNVADDVSAVFDITEGTFFTGYQGAGKTITVSHAAKVIQKMNGGKVLVAAGDETNRANMADTMKGLGVEIDESLTGNVPFSRLKSHLQTNNGDIGLIVYDEATLLSADQVYQLDLMLREINKVREGNPIKIIYVGDKNQIGSSINGQQYNVGAQGKIIIETTNELKFSYRTGNDQINTTLEHLRSILADKNEGIIFTSKYEWGKGKFSGFRAEEGEKFNSAFSDLMKKLNSNDDWRIIADEEFHGQIRKSYDIPEGRLLTPEQAQGKQWDYVIAKINTAKIFDATDLDRKKAMLSVAGRAKRMVLMEVDNTPDEGISRNIHSVKGPTKNVVAAIKESSRLNSKKEELRMMEGLNFDTFTEPEHTVSHETVKIVNKQLVTEIVDVAEESLSSEDKIALDNIINKVSQLPKLKGVASDKAYVMMHTFYSYAESYDEDGNPQSITDIKELLRMKKKLIYPDGEDIDVRFSLEIHGNERPTVFKTLKNPGKQILGRTHEVKEEFDDKNKRFVIYATVREGGKDAYKISMGALNDPADFKLDQSELFNVTIPFNNTQSRLYMQSLRMSAPAKTLTPEQEENSIFQMPATFKPRNFEEKGKQMSLEEFKDINGEFWNFSNHILYTTSPDAEKGGHAEKQTWILYSPTTSSSRLDNIARFAQHRIDAPGSDIRKIAVDGGRSVSFEEGKNNIELYYEGGELSLLPHVAKPRIQEMFKMVHALAKSNAYSKKNTNRETDSNLRKVNTKSSKTPFTRMMLDATLFGFYDIPAKGGQTRSTVTQEGTTSDGGVKIHTTKTSKPAKTAPKDKHFSVNRIIHYLTTRENKRNTDGTKTDEAKVATEVLEKIEKQIFPGGFYSPVEQDKAFKTQSRDDPYGIVDLGKSSIESYRVQNLSFPVMPIQNFKLDFIKDVLTNNDALRTKITTRTKYEPVKEAEQRERDETPATDSPFTVRQLVVPKSTTGDETIESKNIQFTSDAISHIGKASMFDIFSRYFNEKPFTYKFEDFVKYFNKKIYDSIFILHDENPDIIVDKIDGTLKKLRKNLQTNSSIISDADRVAEEEGGSLNRRRMLKDEGFSEVYYDYVIGKEFDSMIGMMFPNIKIRGNNYSFENIQHSENQMIDNKETVSHLDRGNAMVKMHFFNMPIFDVLTPNKDGSDNLSFRRYGDRRALAKITRLVRDNNITDLTTAREFFGSQESDSEMYSFYRRFLAPEPTDVNIRRTFNPYHSISSIRNDIAEDTVTGILSFLASGNVSEYVNMNFEKNELVARYTDINVNRYRNDLEGTISSTEDGIATMLDHNIVQIRYGENKDKAWQISSNGKVTPSNKKSNTGHLGQILQTVGIAPPDSRQFEDVWRISTKNNIALTGQTLFKIGKYLAVPKDERGRFASDPGDKTDWIRWADVFQSIKQTDSSYGHTNISGDKVNLIALSYPMIRTNQKINRLRDEDTVLNGNAFVRGDMTIDSYLLKEGFKGQFRSRANKQMTEKEHMNFDFKYLYLESLLRPSNKDPKALSVIFNPMTFADKTSDAVVRTTGDFVPRDGKGRIDITRLRQRTVNSVSRYNTDLGKSIINKFVEAFEELDIKSPVQTAGEGSTPLAVRNNLRKINSFVKGLSKSKRNSLVSTGLVSQLMYQTDETGTVISGVRQGLIQNILPEDVDKEMQKAKSLFNAQTKIHGIDGGITSDHIAKFKSKLKLDVDITSLLDSYFYNHNYVAQNFSTLHVGSVWQYSSNKAFQDQIKRNSQITTNRQKFILRKSDYNPNEDTIKQGRKLGKTSKTVIMTDVEEALNALNYQGKHKQLIFDGAAFHNAYALTQMRESYGNSVGFNVSSTLKPISSYMDASVGHSRFDKYASFEITAEMLGPKGDPFIKKLNELMLSSVKFEVDQIFDLDETPISAGATITSVSDGRTTGSSIEPVIPSNLLELENEIRARLIKEAEQKAADEETDVKDVTHADVVARTLDVMVKNNLQDNYIQEVIFDSSVKTGVSTLNTIESLEDIQKLSKLRFLERGNDERGLILDSSHDPDTYVGAFPTQIISAILQGNFSKTEASNILLAIEKYGNMQRDKIVAESRSNLADDNVEGFIRDNLRNRVNERGDIGLIHRLVNSQHNFSFDNKTIFGQLFSSLATELSKLTVNIKIKGGQQVVAPSYGTFTNPSTGQPLKGFDASNSKGESIKTSQEWLDLVDAVDNKRFKEAKVHRARVHELIRTEYAIIQSPEVIIAPTMFSDFGIPKGTELADIEKGFALGKYRGTYDDFRKTLEIAIVRIPATSKQSYMAAKVVGFAHDAENTFYTNLDLLYLQGADQDIDKGNILTYQIEKGEIIIPRSVDEANTEIQLKNFMVSQIINSSKSADTLMESTTPTSTKTLQSLASKYAKIEDQYVHHMNPWSQATMFVRGQAGKTNISIHANGLKTYSSAFYSYNKRRNSLSTYTAQSGKLGNRKQQIRGIESGDELGYFETIDFYSELINAAVDNSKDPILGAIRVNEATGNLANVFAFLGYSPKQVVDFLHDEKVLEVINDYLAYNEYSIEGKPFKTFEDFASDAANDSPGSAELQDLAYFTKISTDFAMLGSIFSINNEIANSPHDFHKYMNNINSYLEPMGITIQEFVKSQNKESLIEQYDELFKGTGQGYINVLQVLADNEHMMSYITSAVFVEDSMIQRSRIYSNVSTLTNRAATKLGRPLPKNIYNSLNDFTYGLAIDDFLSRGNGKLITMSVNGVRSTYNLSLVHGQGNEYGRIEFMQDFPDYFKGIKQNNRHTLQNRMIVETINEVKILKLEGDFAVQTPEYKVASMSMMESLEDTPGRINKPDLYVEGDSSVRDMLFTYSLIKDKGGNSGTSYTVLFNPEDFEDFDGFLKNWTPAYDINNNEELDDMLEQASMMLLSPPANLKPSRTINKKMRHSLFIPYKNDKTANDVSDLSKDTERITKVSVSNNADLQSAINAGIDHIFTSKEKSATSQKIKIEDMLADAGYGLNKELSSKGNFVWVKGEAPVKSKILRVSPVTYRVIEPDDLYNPPFSKADFETKQKRRNYALQTNSKVLSTIIDTMNNNMNTNAVAMTEGEIKRVYGNKYTRLRGFIRDGVAVINTDRADLDTPMHEMGHLWINALRSGNSELYSRIITDSSNHEMMDKVSEQYPELDGNALAEEVFVTLFGLSQQDKALSSYNRSFITRMGDTIRDFMNWLNDLFGDLFGMQPNTDDTMIDIMNKVGDRMLSSSMFNFSSRDIQVLSTMGVGSTVLSTDLRALQENLVRKGLMETVC